MTSGDFYLGVDFGTSGARAIVIDNIGTVQGSANYRFNEHHSPQMWKTGLFSLLADLSTSCCQKVKEIAINGTSSTVLLCDRQGNCLDDPILYNDGRGQGVREKIEAIAPSNHLVLSSTSSLAKLLWWMDQPYFSQAAYFLHQADWLGFLLHGKLGISDYHNALKLGYDVELLSYPGWIQSLSAFPLLPQVCPPGTPIGKVSPKIAHQFGFPQSCQVCSGTTDSIAAFLASGVTKPGEAVTSLGSTLVLKLLSQTKVEHSDYGIYSHRLGNLWLTGGASNTGGAVLRHFFQPEQLEALSKKINPEQESSLDYYPLLKPGDRFPINDPHLPPRLEPRPANSVAFLQGLLESIARIEAQGYQRLQELGATPLTQVYTAGGGAKNLTWQQIRQRHLKVPVCLSPQTEAAYGTALLAKNGLTTLTRGEVI